LKRPNLLMVTLHDLGCFLPCYGHPIHAPATEALAAEGVVFQNHFSTGTVCSPSRGSIATGCYPHTHGLMGLVHRGWALDTERCPHLASLLSTQGYETWLFGFQHEHWDASMLGYGAVDRCATFHAEDVAQRVAEWLASRGSAEKPFFASVGFSEVHRIGLQPSHFKRNVYRPARPEDTLVPPWLPDIPEIRQDLADFYGAIRHADAMTGVILAALKKAGLEENTIVVFTTDHGASFMHGKATLYDGGCKTALLMRWPEGIPAGRKVAGLTSHVDILPTLFDLMGLPAPAHVQGVSAAGLIRGEAVEERDFVFAEKNYTNFFDPCRMARSQRFKYIRKGLRTSIFDFQIPEIELSAWGWRRNDKMYGFYSSERSQEELFDLDTDPGELRNLAESPSFSGELALLRKALDGHLEATDDPFRRLSIEILMPRDGYAGMDLSRGVRGRPA